MALVVRPKVKRFVVATDDYAAGHHHRIDTIICQRNERRLLDGLKRFDRYEWEKEYVGLWLQNPWEWCMEVVRCPVCSENIVQCMERGEDPFHCPMDIRMKLDGLKKVILKARHEGSWLSKVKP